MSGIIGYIGKKEAFPILIHGLNRFEFRGYDSVGVVTLEKDEYKVFKTASKLKDLKNFNKEYDLYGKIGMGHSRWATHGKPSEENAHPHMSNSGKLSIVHKGIVENYASLKEKLIKSGYTFKSETDTEVLINLIEEVQLKNNLNLETAIQIALNQVVGAYSIIIMNLDEPETIYVARKGSPLVIGVGENEFIIASDTSPIIEFVQKVMYIDEEDIYKLSSNGDIGILNLSNVDKSPAIEALEIELEAIEKGEFKHFMLKEIFEQPKVIIDAFRGRMNAVEGWVKLGGVAEYANKINNAKRLIFAACGTSWHASLLGEYLIEELARIPVEVEYASEFRYRNPIIGENDVFVAISQSGETADTIAAIELAKDRQALIYGICNVVGSTISRLSHAGSYTHAGPEIGIASTKAFSTQVVILTLMALQLADYRGTLSKSQLHEILHELEAIPKKIEEVLKQNEEIKEIAKSYKDASNFLYLGRGANYPVALEGALKLKEISYIHAEGYPAAEVKHGPIALIDENMPTVVLATNESAYDKIVSNIQEIKARKGKVIAVVTEGDTTIKEIADHIIEVPKTDELFAPLITVVPLQLLSYHIALWRGCNVDSPRNLTKSVMVE
ncbi:MAG TPA: glutamine--fructose-6-phosphate transaminase (isomerizing) [Chitinophagaceae bacterium]|nr:glutamine--fructose-6-phosphate transaminase (isomerizing) [Chitinophagaceae bacterium]